MYLWAIEMKGKISPVTLDQWLNVVDDGSIHLGPCLYTASVEIRVVLICIYIWGCKTYLEFEKSIIYPRGRKQANKLSEKYTAVKLKNKSASVFFTEHYY